MLESRSRRRSALSSPIQVTVLVTNYNGRDNLEAYLPQVVARFAHRDDVEVLISDDGSKDDSLAWLAANLPEVRVVAAKVNGGFPKAANQGFRSAKGPFVFLLSSDMVPGEGCLERMEEALAQNPEALCVGGPQWLPDGSDLTGRFTGLFKRGSFRVRPHPTQPEASDPQIWPQVQNAIGLYRRAHFEKLGGFSELFCPFYFEEVDLSYRAWKCGHPILYCAPAGVTHYVESSSIASTHAEQFRKAQHRIHQYFFFWKNIDSKRLWLSHLFWTGLRLPFAWAWKDWAFYKAIEAGFQYRQEIAQERAALLASKVYEDAEVLERALVDQPLSPGSRA